MALERPTTYFDAFLNEKPTVAELCELVRVGAKWHELGILLELDSVNLNGIDELNKDCDFKAMRMFELWLRTKPNATRRQIIETLKEEDIDMNAVAVDYKEALTTKCEYSIYNSYLYLIMKQCVKCKNRLTKYCRNTLKVSQNWYFPQR